MHIGVLKEKVVEYLNVQPNEHFIDATLGAGDHLKTILERNGPKGKVLAIDWDANALKAVKSTLPLNGKKRTTFVHGNFADIKEIAAREKFKPVHGILFDIGLSSDQLEKSGRGFSFHRNEVLDMRFNPEHSMDAKKILNFWSRFDIERILKEYGEEGFAPFIAKEIVKERSQKPIVRTFHLVEVIKRATPKWYHRKKLHPATKTFQALRIAVNSELDNLKASLPQAVEMLEQGGRLVVISFHSLEDRIVKNFFKTEPRLQIITKKPVVPTFQEQKQNPRARSAKLRAAVKL